MSPARRLNMVDLPHPVLPSTATNSPVCTREAEVVHGKDIGIGAVAAGKLLAHLVEDDLGRRAAHSARSAIGR
jgi:hypothetical protein